MMTPLELQTRAKQNESTNINTFPKAAQGFCDIGIALIMIGITLLTQRNKHGNP